MEGTRLLIGTCIGLIIVIFLLISFFRRKKRIKKVKIRINELDREKNLIAGSPIMSELSKIEAILKNEKLENKYHEWQKRFASIKESRIPAINEMIVELYLLTNSKDRKNLELNFAKTELELYKARESVNKLMDEIKEITLSEEKYRNIVIKLKTKYRSFINEFNLNKPDYEEMQTIIELQLENIEKRFIDFENAMEHNEYEEVVHIVKALDAMIDHMAIVIKEVPNLILMNQKLIPNRMKEIKSIYTAMKKEGYPLEYLKIDYNLKESKKHLKDIWDRIKVLNLEDCMFELKTMLEYLNGIFDDFEKEKVCRGLYEESLNEFQSKLSRINKLVKDIYSQIDDIMNMYHLKTKDIEEIDKLKLKLEKLNSDYKENILEADSSKQAYSKLMKELDNESGILKNIEDDLDFALKNLGSMYADEKRAREQLVQIEGLMKESKIRIRTYKLPVIHNNYFIELKEANEAIMEIVKELNKKPIVIKTLNIRVDTARDLALKLHNTTSEMIDKAKIAENVIVYGNRYRVTSDDIDKSLTQAEELFYKGSYQEALDISVNALEKVDSQIIKKINSSN